MPRCQPPQGGAGRLPAIGDSVARRGHVRRMGLPEAAGSVSAIRSRAEGRLDPGESKHRAPLACVCACEGPPARFQRERRWGLDRPRWRMNGQGGQRGRWNEPNCEGRERAVRITYVAAR
jgi:hypothetical protein